MWRPYCLEVGTAGHNFERWPPRDHSIKVWFQYAKQFQLKRNISEFPIGSYVKLNLAVAVNLIGRPGNQIPFWKGIIHRPFNQSLAINGLAVSEEKIVFKVIPLFLFLVTVAILDNRPRCRIQFWKGTIQQQFLQSLVPIDPVVSEEKIKMWIVDGRQVMAKAHMAF